MRPGSRLGLLLAAATGLGFVVVRDVDGDGPISWATPVVTVEVQQDGSDDIDDGSDLAAIRDALMTWNAVACSSFRFVDGGTGTSRSIGNDGVNRITFVEQNWPGYAAGAGAFTVRERRAGDPDRWVDFDIQVNGQDARWATDGTVSRGDIASAMVHELGHGIGLQHSSDPRATMYFSVRLGTTFARTLHPDDIAGVCYAYPAASFSCDSDDDCPLVYAQYSGSNYRTRCQGGACRAGPSSTYGAGCFQPTDCTSGLCIIDPLNPPSSEPGYCSLACDGQPCPGGEYCAAMPGGPRCVVGRVDCAVDADCGGMPRVCARQLDGRFQCQKLCLRDAQCADVPSAVCHGGTGANPAGFCRVPGAGRAGDACQSGLECQSLACTSGGINPVCTPRPGEDAGLPRDALAVDAVSPAPDGGTSAPLDARPIEAADAGEVGAADAEELGGTIRGSCTCVQPSPSRLPYTTILVLILLATRPRRRLTR